MFYPESPAFTHLLLEQKDVVPGEEEQSGDLSYISIFMWRPEHGEGLAAASLAIGEAGDLGAAES